MTRYIDEKKLIDELVSLFQENVERIDWLLVWLVDKAIKNQPTAYVVERKKGEWKSHPTEREWDFCSNCGVGVHRREYGYNEDGTEWVEEVSYIFCPWCGADMRGENNG